VTARPYRVLVTGSRDWEDVDLLRHQLTLAWLQHPGPFVVVHGGCPTGADDLASDLVANMLEAEMGDVSEEAHPADWKQHGRAAGPIRNQHMVNLGADLVLAFIRNGSRGASGCAALAEAAGIHVRRFTN
jgi:hypothetical protein